MWRTIGAIVAGLVSWAVIVTILNFGLRAALPGYHAAEATLQFSLSMQIGRLLEAVLTSVAAGAVVAFIAPSKRWVPWVTGMILLGLFLPEHIKLWSKFPLWYHLTFLITILPLVALGASLVKAVRSERRPATA